MSPEQQKNFAIPTAIVTYVLIGCIALAFAVSMFIFVLQLNNERVSQLQEARNAKMRRLRKKADDEEVVVPKLSKSPKQFHLFLSHVWCACTHL